MDACSLNWELASKFIPLVTPIVAWCIFRQWKKQKRAELLSSKCHDTYRDLNNFCELMNDYVDAHKDNLNHPENNNVLYGAEKDLKLKVEDLYKKILSDLELISFESKDESINKHYENFKLNFDKLAELMYKTLEKGSFQKNKLSFQLDDKGDEDLRYYKIIVNENRKDIQNNINNLKKILPKFIFFNI